MAKSPGFWFFTGDWMKDPELRFCSLFARGLLVDLLCILFEAKEQGFASKPDGTPRSDSELADAISGGTREEKLAAIRELEHSGVLSRDNRGVLYSRRLSRLGEISKTRSKAGSKGGSKTQAKGEAKAKQNLKQTDKQNTGVSVSDSASVSDIISPPLTARDVREIRVPIGWERQEFRTAWGAWCNLFLSTTGRDLPEAQAQAQINLMAGRGDVDKAIADLNFTTQKGAKSLLDSANDYEKQRTQSRTQSNGRGVQNKIKSLEELEAAQ
jgi:hypothetical protein